MWRISPLLLGGGTHRVGGVRAVATTTAKAASIRTKANINAKKKKQQQQPMLKGMTPYRLFCAVNRADPALAKKSPAGRVAVLMNRFKRLSPQARGGLVRILQAITVVPPRKQADRFKEVVMHRRRVNGFSFAKKSSVATQKKATLPPTTTSTASSSTKKLKKNKAAVATSLKNSKKNNTTISSSKVAVVPNTQQKSTANNSKRRRRITASLKASPGMKRRRAEVAMTAAKKKKEREANNTKPPSASAPYKAHVRYLLHRIRTNKVGPRDAAKMLNELRRKFK